jgi:hypothetical protein
MAHYSYRVLADGKGWRWDVISPSGEIVSRGVADTRAKAAAHAILFWLTRIEEGDSPEHSTNGVRH